MSTEDPQPRYDIRVVRHVKIPMPDGVQIDAHLVMPDAPGRFPAVFDYYPYRKDDMTASTMRLHHYLARRGFVALRLDVRGTGGSEGVVEDEYSLQEQLDAVEAIDWMSKQDWCNGNVGMFGSSYGGFNSLQVAMHRPPALKAICPMYFTDNRYTDDCHYKGGTLQMLYDMGTYGLSMVLQNALPPYPAGTEHWAEVWEARLSGNEPWIMRWLEHQTYDEQWKHGSLCEDYGAIQCAALLIGGWRDGYTNCNLRAFQHLRCPKKVLIGPWLHVAPDVAIPGPRIDHLHEMARFYEYWLKDVDNGVMDEPPMAIYMQTFDLPEAERKLTSGFWRHEPGWPLERSSAHTLFLAHHGALRDAPPSEEGTISYAYNSTVGTTFGMFSAGSPLVLPMDQRLEEAFSPGCTSAPLDEPVEILGHPRAVLNLSASAEIATVVVRLIDVGPDGAAALVTKGVLNLTHRESHEQPAPLIPGHVYEVAVELDATGWRFEAGHRIRVGLSGADFPNSWPAPTAYTTSVMFGGSHTSRLELPTLAPQEPPLPAPQFRPPEQFEPLAQSYSDRPIWRVTHDHIAGTAEVQIGTAGRTRLDDGTEIIRSSDATAIASQRDPAHATMRGLNQVMLRWADRTIEARARGQIESSAVALHVTIQLDITLDGVPYHSRRWARSIPRHLL
ncbi:MAG TPA: CocE/NonD family hydrolase [Roseiflexaceae bacterium]|nr:CocE/NonD family hydrolase [Roseiflexaceae bacterium]